MTGRDRHSAAVMAERLVKQGDISRLGRDVYTVQKDPFLIASHIHWPSYISLWSALRYYNLTEQLPHSVEVVTPVRSRKKSLKFQNSEILFTRTQPRYFFGFRKIRYGDYFIFIADKEKAFVDAALFQTISFSELADMLKTHKRHIRFSKLTGYALKIGNTALIKRFGFLADRLGYDFHARLKKRLYAVYSRLDYSLPPHGKRNKKWFIIENTVV